MSANGVEAGWFADPTGRFELRYWDGTGWTDQVSRAEARSVDPEGLALPAPKDRDREGPWTPPPPPSARRGAWLWALVGALAVFVLGVGGCITVSVVVVDRVADEFRDRQERHAITLVDYERVQIGQTRDEVIETLGKEPQNAAQFVVEGVVNEGDLGPDCIYYLRESDAFFPSFRFCFDDDVLVSKASG